MGVTEFGTLVCVDVFRPVLLDDHPGERFGAVWFMPSELDTYSYSSDSEEEESDGHEDEDEHDDLREPAAKGPRWM